MGIGRAAGWARAGSPAWIPAPRTPPGLSPKPLLGGGSGGGVPSCGGGGGGGGPGGRRATPGASPWGARGPPVERRMSRIGLESLEEVRGTAAERDRLEDSAAASQGGTTAALARTVEGGGSPRGDAPPPAAPAPLRSAPPPSPRKPPRPPRTPPAAGSAAALSPRASHGQRPTRRPPGSCRPALRGAAPHLESGGQGSQGPSQNGDGRGVSSLLRRRVTAHCLRVPSPHDNDQIPTAVWALKGHHRSLPYPLPALSSPQPLASGTWASVLTS